MSGTNSGSGDVQATTKVDGDTGKTSETADDSPVSKVEVLGKSNTDDVVAEGGKKDDISDKTEITIDEKLEEMHISEYPDKILEKGNVTADPEETVLSTNESSTNPDANGDVKELPTRNLLPQRGALELENTTEIFFDLETTGLARTSHITQIAAVREEETFSTYIMPKTSINPKASEVTGISVVNGAMFHKDKQVPFVSITSGLDQFCEFLQKSKNNILIGHNIQSFDCKVLLNALRNCEKLADFHANANVIGFVDTLKLFRLTHPGRSSYSQTSLVRDLIHAEYPAHDALEDVKALKRLLDGTGIENQCKQEAFFSFQDALDA